ncbi:MAG: DinB family protein, partial [Candidatus Acidiferrales bacterium]
EQVQLSPSPHLWPIWATIGHLAGARVYWLCAIFNEPGAEQTPFAQATPEGWDGWEDNLDHPREPDELIAALESTWRIVQACLESWTPEMLQQEFRRERGSTIQMHTRQSVLMRLITHACEHIGEICVTLGMNRLQEIDLWSGLARIVE